MIKRTDSIEDSQKFISSKYDTAIEKIQTKKEMNYLSSKDQEEAILGPRDVTVNSVNRMDEIQQYLHRQRIETSVRSQ